MVHEDHTCFSGTWRSSYFGVAGRAGCTLSAFRSKGSLVRASSLEISFHDNPSQHHLTHQRTAWHYFPYILPKQLTKFITINKYTLTKVPVYAVPAFWQHYVHIQYILLCCLQEGYTCTMQFLPIYNTMSIYNIHCHVVFKRAILVPCSSCRFTTLCPYTIYIVMLSSRGLYLYHAVLADLQHYVHIQYILSCCLQEGYTCTMQFSPIGNTMSIYNIYCCVVFKRAILVPCSSRQLATLCPYTIYIVVCLQEGYTCTMQCLPIGVT